MTAESADGVGEVVNFGSNFEISIGQVVEAVGAAIGRDITVDTDEARIRPSDSEVDRLWADNSKAERVFGWSPAYGGLDGFFRGIAETVSWFSVEENRSTYKPGTYAV
jgi:dTDP-glucose 4,6-dehydratase